MTKPYTVVGLFLDHPSAVGETFLLHVEAERPQDFEMPESLSPKDDGARTWAIVAIFDGHITPSYMEKLV